MSDEYLATVLKNALARVEERLADLNKTLTRTANLLELQVYQDLRDAGHNDEHIKDVVTSSLVLGNAIREARQEAKKER